MPAFAEDIVKQPDFFALEMRKPFSRHLAKRLDKLGQGAAEEPFLVVRGAYPTCLLPVFSYSARIKPELTRGTPYGKDPLYENEKWYLKRGTYELISAGLIALAGCQLRDKKGSGKAFREYFTATDHQINAFADGGDLHLRFRQATPELTVVTAESSAADKNKMSSRLALLVCVENPINEPIYVLPVAEVVRRLDQTVVDQLVKPQYVSFDNWKLENLSLEERSVSQPLLTQEGSQWWLSFDPNRLNLEVEQGERAKFAAVAKLLSAIHEASDQARPVVLHRGDALLVHNHLALVRRKEQSYRWLNMPTWGRPPVRWLRVYYGFPSATHK